MKNKILRCADFGTGCPTVFRGRSVSAVLELAKKHGMAAHGQTREQVESEKTARIAAEKTRDE